MIHTSKQLKDKVRNISHGDNQTAQMLIRNFIMERFLERVSISPYRNNFILKGGMLVASLVGIDTRATMDIDSTLKALPLNEEDAVRIVNEIIRIHVEDGISFEVVKSAEIMTDFGYPGVRLVLEARLDRLKQRIKIDLSSFLHFTDKIGSLCVTHTIEPGEEKNFTFILSWYFPNRPKMWIELDKDKFDIKSGNYQVTKNYYATLFANAWEVTAYLSTERERLYRESKTFSEAFFSTTLPGYVLEAVADNITVMRSPTCFRIENGDFLGWEGVDDDLGCGPGNCTHVWNYAQSVAVLFPELERTMRRIELVDEIRDDGYMPFRAYTPFDLPQWDMVASADGQLESVVRLYREWIISGNDSIVRECWPGVKKTMRYVLKVWDCDGDG